MQITHNNKTYRWIGDKWGETFIDEYSIFWQWDMLVYFQYGSDIIKTYHTPEQLVKLGYLEEVKENKQTLTLPEMEYKWEREYYRNWIKLEKLKEIPSYDEMVSMWMPTELTGCQWVITEHNIGSMGYHQDVENTILRNQEDWKREHGFLPEEVRPEHPKWYLYPETINSYYDTNKTKEWNYQEYQKQLKKAQDEWWAGIKENKEPDTSILEKLREKLERKVQQTIEQIEKTQQIRDCERLNVLREIQYLLTSLEQPQTKVDTEAKVWQELNKKQDAEFNAQPQFTPWQTNYCDSRTDDERARDEELYRTATVTSTSNVWTPTPWQEIEVSNDGEKWYKYRFSMMSWTAPTIYIVNVDTENWQYACSYRFARPIEDKIELLPPHEFSYDSQTEFEMIVMQRLELLTNALNQLISK